MPHAQLQHSAAMSPLGSVPPAPHPLLHQLLPAMPEAMTEPLPGLRSLPHADGNALAPPPTPRHQTPHGSRSAGASWGAKLPT